MHEAVKWGEKLGVMEELFFSGLSVCERASFGASEKYIFRREEEETEQKFLVHPKVGVRYSKENERHLVKG
jgi:hypothetical protein